MKAFSKMSPSLQRTKTSKKMRVDSLNRRRVEPLKMRIALLFRSKRLPFLPSH
jgi:hypothetical protein